MKLRNLLLAGFLLAAPLVPLPASAAEVCENGICTVTFQFTGSQQSWQVPTGVTKINFKVFGASGGRGGAGGEVRGELSNLPNTLYFFVGGQGIEGNNAPGGYNGGGPTTGNRGNEGSGGGASDIRFGLGLSDRVVVAGGGGGAGGYAGAPGGMGGGLVAETGGSGQGGGGGGGTQTSGGSAGFSNGGSPATSGSFGIGGTGGFSWNAGGGGGGGGWYGGGGGGPDDNSCCSDGGGGGGGSSYARSDITVNVQHLAGVNTGNGRIEISYQQVVVVVSFMGQQVDSELAKFNLVMSANIVGLTPDDFLISQPLCQVSNLAVTAAAASISLTGCQHGSISLTLKSNSIGQAPLSAITATINFDKESPTFSWGEIDEQIASQSIEVGYLLSEGDISAESFDFGECQAVFNSGVLLLTDCPEGENTVQLKANELSDQWGNLGPAEPLSISFMVDLTPPDAIWSEVEMTRSENFRYSAMLSFTEFVEFDPSVVEFSSDSECATGYEFTNEVWNFFSTCSYASGSWILPAISASDSAGNAGPAVARIATFNNPQPVIAPAPQPQPEPQPQPQPIEAPVISFPIAPEPTQPEQITAPAPIVEMPSESEQEPVIVIENPPVMPQVPLTEPLSSQQVETLSPVQEPVKEDSTTAEDVEIVDVPIEQASGEALLPPSQPPYLLFGLALLAVSLLGFLGWRFIGR